jgi:lipoprotein-anchoring transpeptidase ErfK/SrfK
MMTQDRKLPDLNRRRFLTGLAAIGLGAAAAPSFAIANALYGGDDTFSRDYSLLPPAESPVDFEIAPINLAKIPDQFQRQLVAYDGPELAGTIIISPQERLLYLIRENGQALRFGVGVGRQGFAWSGEAVIGLKRRWPRWLPPEEMVLRDANAAKWANGMPGGPENPLGARALYLYANGADTMYRIHGTNDPKSIGKAMSSGCIRMLNQDVAELYLRVPLRSRVVVMPQDSI